mmetsp:Transcript_15224/g.20612  ORF Transcript_15224/g.20612 Transcript_15224/m.20612 type:complete len:112 (+) Transcript_15224:1787-2122(+)
MYFIVKGRVAIGFSTFQQPSEQERYTCPYFLDQADHFGDYYILHNKKSEFVYVAETEVEAYSISKKTLMSKVFPKYPEIYNEFIERSLKHYENMRESVLKHKQNHIDVVNK